MYITLYCISLVIRELQIKQQWDTTTPLLGWPKFKTQNCNSWQECGATETLIDYWWECKMVEPLWKTLWKFLIKLNILLPYNPVIVCHGINPKDLKTYIFTEKKLHRHIYRSFIYTCQNLEAIKITFRKWMDKQTVVCPDTGILFGTEKKSAMKIHRGSLNEYY